MFGDFNAIYNYSEKLRGPSRFDSSFEDFKEMLWICKMSKLSNSVNPFTRRGMRGK